MAGEESLEERLERKLGPGHGDIIHFMLGKDQESCTLFGLDIKRFPDLVNSLDGFMNLLCDRGVAHAANHSRGGA